MLDDGQNIPKSYNEAVNSKEKNEWKKSMKTEFQNMEAKGVWRLIKKKDIPPGRKLIQNRWVYARKDDGRYRARCVAKEFSQIPWKRFSRKFCTSN